MKACLVGPGYIGLPTAIIAVEHGVETAGVDINVQVVEVTNQGELYIVEPGIEDILQEVLASGHFKAHTESRVSNAYFMVVSIPFEGDHEPDVSFVESAIRMVFPLLKEGDLYVIESTSPVGTTERTVSLVFSEWPELKGKIYTAYCLRWVLLGNVIYELVYNDQVTGDVDKASVRKAMEFYDQFVKGTPHLTNSEATEMCKLTENSSRDVQIAFINGLSFICGKAGINVWELIDLANRHPRVNILQPSCGVGGRCIAAGPYFVTVEFPMESRTISTARKTSSYKVFRCAEKVRNAVLRSELERGRKPVVAMVGSASEPDIDDLHESPTKGITTKVLQSCNNVDIMMVEPNASEHKLFKLTPYKKVYEKADIVAFLMNHREFPGLNYRSGVEVLDSYGTLKK